VNTTVVFLVSRLLICFFNVSSWRGRISIKGINDKFTESGICGIRSMGMNAVDNMIKGRSRMLFLIQYFISSHAE